MGGFFLKYNRLGTHIDRRIRTELRSRSRSRSHKPTRAIARSDQEKQLWLSWSSHEVLNRSTVVTMNAMITIQ